MALTILNNIASLAAENQLTETSNALKSTLFQLSSGSRINSGADDAAGLAIANGLQANISALSQSANNANDGVGLLQVADGSYAQVTTMLNRAVTLATESATGTVSDQQRKSLDSEYMAIQSEINRIGAQTNYNGQQVFNGTALNVYLGDGTGNTQSTNNLIGVTINQLTAAGLGLGTAASGTISAISNANAGDKIAVSDGTKTWTYNFVSTLDGTAENQVLIGSTAGETLANLANAINGGSGLGTTYTLNDAGAAGTQNVANTDVQAGNVTSTSIGLEAVTPGVTGNSISVTYTVNTGDTAALGFSSSNTGTPGDLGGGSGSTAGLTSQAGAEAELGNINAAMATIAAQRGALGATINRLQTAGTVISNQVQNLTSAENGITAADIPSAVANMTKFSILEQTGISALAQANQQQQLVLKLLQ